MPHGERGPASQLDSQPLAPLPSTDNPESPPDPLAPLLSYYRLLDRTPPQVRFLPPALLPAPYAQLLHHTTNMTPTLSAYHRSPLHLHVLHQQLTTTTPTNVPETCSRYVRLLRNDGACVEFGCIDIDLRALPTAGGVREAVLGGVRPFGGVLLEAGVVQVCEVRGLFEVEEDDVIRHAMGGVGGEKGTEERGVIGGEKSGRVLYGRCNVISGKCGRVIARVVEILPSVDSIPQTTSGETETTSTFFAQ